MAMGEQKREIEVRWNVLYVTTVASLLIGGSIYLVVEKIMKCGEDDGLTIALVGILSSLITGGILGMVGLAQALLNPEKK